MNLKKTEENVLIVCDKLLANFFGKLKFELSYTKCWILQAKSFKKISTGFMHVFHTYPQGCENKFVSLGIELQR
mgnify:FL=1